MTEKQVLRRCLCGFGDDDELHFEAPLDEIEVSELKEIGGCEDADEDMVGIYSLEPDKLPLIEKHLGITLDKTLEYTIEAYFETPQGG